MVDLVEACLDVGVEHPVCPPIGRYPDRFESLVSGALGPEPIALREEIGLENGFEDDLGRRHDNPVGHSRDAERPGLTRLARFGDVDPSQGLRAIRLCLKCCGEAVEEHLDPVGATFGDRRNAHAVNSGGTLVLCHLDPGPPQDVAAGDLVVEGVEASGGILLGTAIEHALKGSDRVHAFGVADGSSRVFGTHQGSSPSSQCTGEAGALRSGRVMLSRPSSLLRPPPTSSRLPGTSRVRRL